MKLFYNSACYLKASEKSDVQNKINTATFCSSVTFSVLKHFILSQLNMQRQLQYTVSKPFEKYIYFLCGTMKIPLFVLSELSYPWTVTWVGDGTVCSGGVFKNNRVSFCSSVQWHSFSLQSNWDSKITLYICMKKESDTKDVKVL